MSDIHSRVERQEVMLRCLEEVVSPLTGQFGPVKDSSSLGDT